MFENLSDRLQNAVNKIKGYGRITEDNISEVTREIRLALLEADVNYKVVKEFINSVKEKALGEEVAKSLKPGEQFVKILKDELVELLGGEKADLYTIGFTNDVKTLTDHVGTTNITKSFTATTSSDLYAAFDELEDEINDLPVVTKVTDKTGKVDLSDYASLDLKTVVFYKGATATGDNILKSYTGAEFKALLISGQFDLAAFINSDEVKDKLTETDTINVEIVVNK